jgi:hypothetical protein
VEAGCEIIELFACDGIDDADAFERNIQIVCDRFYFRGIAEQNGRPEPQRLKLPRRLQDARLLALGENHALGMTLQFFDGIADETHRHRLAVKPETAK